MALKYAEIKTVKVIILQNKLTRQHKHPTSSRNYLKIIAFGMLKHIVLAFFVRDTRQ